MIGILSINVYAVPNFHGEFIYFAGAPPFAESALFFLALAAKILSCRSSVFSLWRGAQENLSLFLTAAQVAEASSSVGNRREPS